MAVRIPKPIAEIAGVREGDALAVSGHHGGAIVLRRARPRYRLEDLVAKISGKNRHDETDWGPRVGKEVW